MIIIAPGFSSGVWSQAADPCKTCVSFTPVGAPNVSTDISSILPISDCALIRGRLDEEDSKKAERRQNHQFTIWPNPASTTVTINAPMGSQWLEIFDALGNAKLRQPINGGNMSLDIEVLPSGMYVIVIRQEKEIMSQILSIQR